MTPDTTPTPAERAEEHVKALQKQVEDMRRHLRWLSEHEPYADEHEERGRLRAIETLHERIAAWEAGADALTENARLRASWDRMSAALDAKIAECDGLSQDGARLRMDVARLREALADAIERVEDGMHHKGEYLAAKYGDAEAVTRYRALLAPAEVKP